VCRLCTRRRLRQEPGLLRANLRGPIACKSDKACLESGGVCIKASGGGPRHCVDCNQTADCEHGRVCKAHHCVVAPPVCTATKDCAYLGQVCDTKEGICADCVTRDDCDESQRCADSLCLPKSCKPGERVCSDLSTRQVCDASGGALVSTKCAAVAFSGTSLFLLLSQLAEIICAWHMVSPERGKGTYLRRPPRVDRVDSHSPVISAS